jgi:hypothetical protein
MQTKIDAVALPKMYRKTALVAAEQFLPEQGMIPAGVISDGNGDPRKDSNFSFVLDTKEGRHHLRHGDYVCTGPAGEKWNVERSIFESTYELATANVADGGDGEPDEEAAFDKAISTPDANGWTDREAYDGAKLGLIKQGWMKRAALSTIKTTAKAARCLYPNCGCTSRATCNLKTERAATQPAGEVRFRPIRRTSDGVLKECPCCCSLDVGGAYHTVHCQECGLTVSDPGPLQEAIDKWNLRPQPTYAAPISEASAARVTSKADAERVAKQCEECGGKFGVHSAWCSVITPSSPEAKSETSELPGLPESKDRGIYDDIEGKVRVKWYDADEMRAYGQLCRDTATSVTVSEDAGRMADATKVISMGDGFTLQREAKTTGGAGWLLYNENRLVRSLGKFEIEFVEAALAARTPATPGSIADDEEFCAHAGNYRRVRKEESADKFFAAMCARIDTIIQGGSKP